jgi:TRAP-type C4-dicarboxylate transport system permease small subunit
LEIDLTKKPTVAAFWPQWATLWGADMAKSIESLFGAALVLAALVLFMGGMMLRWTGSPYAGGWVEEVTIYLVAWGMLLSTASAVALNEQVRADFVVRMVGPRLEHWADVLAALAGLAFCAAMAWFGWEVVTFAIRWDERGPSILQIPTVYYYAALPVSMALCAVRYVLKLVALTRNRPSTGF